MINYRRAKLAIIKMIGTLKIIGIIFSILALIIGSIMCLVCTSHVLLPDVPPEVNIIGSTLILVLILWFIIEYMSID